MFFSIGFSDRRGIVPVKESCILALKEIKGWKLKDIHIFAKTLVGNNFLCLMRETSL